MHPAARIDLAALNGADDETCAAMLEPLVERSPWVAVRVAAARPFAGPEALSEAIGAAIFGLTPEDRLRLLRAHPELAMPTPKAMTKASQQEQGRLGLTAPTGAVRARIAELNARYQARFGFPFVIALHRVSDVAAVMEQFEQRLAAAPEAEILTALAEVASVSRARVTALVGRNRSEATQ